MKKCHHNQSGGFEHNWVKLTANLESLIKKKTRGSSSMQEHPVSVIMFK